MGGRRTASPQGTSQAPRRQAARRRPSRAHGHPVRAQDGHPLGDAPPREGLRFGHDLLAASEGVAPSRGVGAPARGVARPPGRADRIDWSRASLDSAAVPTPGGRKDWSQPDGSRQTGLETPSCGRPKRRPARGIARGDQRPRLEGLRGSRRRHSSYPPTSRPPEEAAREATRRQRLRLPPLSKGAPEARDKGAHRPARRRHERAAGTSPVGGRADTVMAQSLPTTEGALRAAGRHPPGVYRAGLRADLLEPRSAVLLGVLRLEGAGGLCPSA